MVSHQRLASCWTLSWELCLCILWHRHGHHLRWVPSASRFHHVRKGCSRKDFLTLQILVKGQDRKGREPEVYVNLPPAVSCWDESVATTNTAVVTMEATQNGGKDRRPICVGNTNPAGCSAVTVTRDSSRGKVEQSKAGIITQWLTLAPAVPHCPNQPQSILGPKTHFERT